MANGGGIVRGAMDENGLVEVGGWLWHIAMNTAIYEQTEDQTEEQPVERTVEQPQQTSRIGRTIGEHRRARGQWSTNYGVLWSNWKSC